MSGLSRIGISIFNYCLFFLSLVLMTWLFQEDSKPDLLRFTVLLTFPSSIIFYLPYTEGCFIATMSIMVAGILRGRYMMYFLGAALLAMVRPATVFVLLALIAVQVVKFLQGRKWVECLFSGIRYTLPFATGYFFSAAIQRYYSGSWTIFFQAQKSWEGGRLTRITRITDWSIEGFGLSAFAIFFICLPATFYLLRYVWKHLQKVNRRPMSATEEIWLVSLFYLAGIFVYIAATSGGNLHSLWRFTLGSPPFFIAAFLACHQLELKKVSPLILYLAISAASLFLFLYFVPYGGKRIDFSFAGMYLAILSWSFVILKRKGTTLPWLLMAIPLILLNVVWNVFLFNAFLSRAWIFT